MEISIFLSHLMPSTECKSKLEEGMYGIVFISIKTETINTLPNHCWNRIGMYIGIVYRQAF